ncbi:MULTISPECIES: CBS domain-containing protein [Thermomonospora]|uniref:Putative signal transduction protein with CBS domains n=1 Tax=Thermomonospora curvata (strain ATCC 19995 / DSM 43183 / JCM 3096 / KCTC 9072 / NBRC 15933 / NCIMB 10081 / Henssen B9) TaxID=471852 RepID=D1A5D8_THECD|nr:MULTISPECIES: CBS domain-containing protein [Thermomonospora]ACY96298.1 putative signal transduction protein with CBS domains [Thermomonospora curvata DSM 43183]PKK15715.1 MAG: CBS domain-containing protein [Thermomonospora sp. CIF 1]
MRIGNIYRPTVIGCRPGERLADAARRMAEEKVGALPLLDGDRVIGIITERDLVTAMADAVDPDATDVASYATDTVQTADVNEDSQQVARRMLEAGIRHLPVREGGRMVGMVSMRDLLALETWMS